MNIIVDNCKQVTNIVGNLLKSRGYLSRRYASTVADYKITWTRPSKICSLSPEKSGDQGISLNVKPSDFADIYKQSSELKNASDIVKRMFTLEFLPRKETVNARRERMLDLVKRHELDRRSFEATTALLTNQIHQLQENLKQYPRNGKTRTFLSEAIQKRRKYLSLLRKSDYRRFEWVLEKLNLVYKPAPEPPQQITRKDSLRRLTKKHCDQLMQNKLNAYKMELKMLQKDFYKEKAEKLVFIREEELACGLQPSVSEEDIIKVKEQVIQYET